ncbi:MAG TPA: hypothetical protein ENN77_00255 [Candidatus Wirthbacteria bacterium]|nr:hypothetical protein [Candidatus Wirthbacteria bacterium]
MSTSPHLTNPAAIQKHEQNRALLWQLSLILNTAVFYRGLDHISHPAIQTKIDDFFKLVSAYLQEWQTKTKQLDKLADQIIKLLKTDPANTEIIKQTKQIISNSPQAKQKLQNYLQQNVNQA